MNLDTPEGRLAAIESLGIERYNAAMKAERDKSIVGRENGYTIRIVNSPYGRLHYLSEANIGFYTEAEARAHAKTLPAR